MKRRVLFMLASMLLTTFLGTPALAEARNTLFIRWAELEVDAAQLAAGLRQQKVIVRHFKLPRIDQHLRISIGSDAEMDEFLQRTAEILREAGR